MPGGKVRSGIGTRKRMTMADTSKSTNRYAEGIYVLMLLIVCNDIAPIA